MLLGLPRLWRPCEGALKDPRIVSACHKRHTLGGACFQVRLGCGRFRGGWYQAGSELVQRGSGVAIGGGGGRG